MTDTKNTQARDWTSTSNQHRRYLNDWAADLADLEVDYYKSGNIRSAALAGEGISNSEACRILAIKVWLDDADEVHVDRNGSRTFTDSQIVELVNAATII